MYLQELSAWCLGSWNSLQVQEVVYMTISGRKVTSLFSVKRYLVDARKCVDYDTFVTLKKYPYLESF